MAETRTLADRLGHLLDEHSLRMEGMVLALIALANEAQVDLERRGDKTWSNRALSYMLHETEVAVRRVRDEIEALWHLATNESGRPVGTAATEQATMGAILAELRAIRAIRAEVDRVQRETRPRGSRHPLAGDSLIDQRNGRGRLGRGGPSALELLDTHYLLRPRQCLHRLLVLALFV